ncbi:MAG: glycosyltransferase [Anaerolineales bacterium]|nr:glycosyltransferase [Anaerolineales bacterium]
MRIAYLTQPYPPMVSGASAVAEHLAKEMAARGHEVLVIAASERDHAYTQTEGNLTVMRLKSIKNPLRVGQKILLFPRNKVLKALNDFEPDVIHAHEPIQMGSLGLEFASQARIPITMTTHQLPWFVSSYLPDKFGIRKIVETLLWEYAGRLTKKFSAVISPTQTISRIIKRKIGIKPKTISYGINLKIFHPHTRAEEEFETRAKFDLPLNKPIILHTGRLDADKSVKRVILATAPVLRESDAHLLVVGDGNQKQSLEELCRLLGIESRVRFTGFISNKKELAKIYRTSDLFITASEIETQGIAILEAAASGLPIAAVKATCIPEIVQHGNNGYLTNPGDINAMSKSIRRILSDPTKTSEMKMKSRIIAEKFKSEITFTKHEKLYKQMISQKSRQTFATRKPAKNPLYV